MHPNTYRRQPLPNEPVKTGFGDYVLPIGLSLYLYWDKFWSKHKKRKLENNTYLVQTNRGYGILLHRTIVVEIQPDRVVLNTGGWPTVTTKDRIHKHLALDYAPYSVYSTRGTWFVSKSPHHLPNGKTRTGRTRLIPNPARKEFYDGITIFKDGRIE